MSDNTRQVLEMLAAGTITTQEAARLIEALREPSPSTATSAAPAEKAAKPRYLRVMVDAADHDDGPTKINLRVPLQLLRAGVRLASLLPSRVQVEINDALRKEGIDVDITKLKGENVDELIEELSDTSVDISSRDDVKVRVFTE